MVEEAYAPAELGASVVEAEPDAVGGQSMAQPEPEMRLEEAAETDQATPDQVGVDNIEDSPAEMGVAEEATPDEPIPDATAPNEIPPAETPDDKTEDSEYGTWLRRLNRQWDPGQTGTHDAWSRAAPQAETSAGELEPGSGPNSEAEPGPDIQDQASTLGGVRTDPAEPDPEPEPESAPTAETQEPARGADTGISYVESWAEELLAEVERGDTDIVDTDIADTGTADTNTGSDARHDHHSEMPDIPGDANKPLADHQDEPSADDALATHAETPELTMEAESDADLSGSDASESDGGLAFEEDADQGSREIDPEAAPVAPAFDLSEAAPIAEPELQTRELETAAHEPEQADPGTAPVLLEAEDNQAEDAQTTDPGEQSETENWLDATWVSDTQPSQPEPWLEPGFLDQDLLPEKLEGSGTGSGDVSADVSADGSDDRSGNSEELTQSEPETAAPDRADEIDQIAADSQADGTEHAATDPAIPAVAIGKAPPATGRDWPAFDDSSVIENIVLESDEPGEAMDPAAVADATAESTAETDPGTSSGHTEAGPTVARKASLLASGAESTGRVQAAAVQVSTDPQFAADQPDEQDPELSAAASAEQVARELGLPRTSPLLRWTIRLLVLLMILAVLAAGVHSQRGVLMRNPALAPTLNSAYAIFGMDLQPAWEVSAFDILDSSARSENNDLIVEAAFANTAEFAQPYPVLRVTLENRWGQAIGQEDFLPRNYLRAYAAGRLMSSGERARAEVTLRSPGTAAEGFSVDVCLESPGGRLQCLSDRR